MDEPNAREGSGSVKDPKKIGERLAMKGEWSFMKHPSEFDVKRRRGHRAFDIPQRSLDFLVVLDFEWTCDRHTRIERPEIIEFPSVLVRLTPDFAYVDEFQVYCRPEEREGRITRFCTELTAITQATVDGGVKLLDAMQQHAAWLAGHGLIPQGSHVSLHTESRSASYSEQWPDGFPTFAVLTWGDADMCGVFHDEMKRKNIQRPYWFRRWINLKQLYVSFYKQREERRRLANDINSKLRHSPGPPKAIVGGGLKATVEQCGLEFLGRAHSGIVDARNTARIVEVMVRDGYVFRRPTRTCDDAGVPWGRDRRRDAGSALQYP